MGIIEIASKNKLNDYVAHHEHSQFLQSWEWGEFQKRTVGKIIRIGVEKDDRLIAIATLIKKLLPFGKSYFYCPRGPIVNNWKSEINSLLFNRIMNLAKEEGAIFLRLDPLSKFQITNFKFQRTIDVQPSRTLILDLTKSEDELLKNMHQKTRYNIRLAERRGINIIEDNINDFEKFWQIIRETSRRDRFRLHERNYYKEMIGINNNFIKLFSAKYKKRIIATNIVSFFGDTVTYLHGGAKHEYRNVMAPHLLQWYTIKGGKRMGYKYYDYNGIDKDRWPGVTRFKSGFGGEQIEYPGTFDLIFCRKLYNIYKLARKIRRVL